MESTRLTIYGDNWTDETNVTTEPVNVTIRHHGMSIQYHPDNSGTLSVYGGEGTFSTLKLSEEDMAKMFRWFQSYWINRPAN